ncbi:MAG TPA: lanthionine synthetase LanC family protein [Verrucomicrobiae bacterium]|nr:lanthionine synthetase LanC family protein [Verrucomicrobiae bacterium]
MSGVATEGGLLYSPLRERARRTAIELGERLLQLASAAADDALHQWAPARGLNGSPGYALAFLELARATGDSRFEAEMHRQLRLAAAVDDDPQLGLYSGISGLRASAEIATAVEPRYVRLVEQCDAFVDARRDRLTIVPRTFSDFDVISGWSGVRLARCVRGAREPDAAVGALLWVIEDESRWRRPHPFTGSVENDVGLAHGMPGMLATLALTLDEIDQKLCDKMRECAWNLTRYTRAWLGCLAWPVCAQAEPREWYRTAWCYGATGVLASLHAVARRIGDAELEAYALGGLDGWAQRICSPSFSSDQAICHGTSGNALIFASVAASSGVASLQAAARRLVAETIARLEGNGYLCLVPTGDDGGTAQSYGELTGTAGVILMLLTLAGDADSAWMRCHALHPLG